MVLQRRLEMVEGLTPVHLIRPMEFPASKARCSLLLQRGSENRTHGGRCRDVEPRTNWTAMDRTSSSIRRPLTIPVSLRPGSEHSQDATREMRMRRLVDSEWRTRNLLRDAGRNGRQPSPIENWSVT